MRSEIGIGEITMLVGLISLVGGVVMVFSVGTALIALGALLIMLAIGGSLRG